MKRIVVLLNYARSGGTLLNKCLASLPNVIMLSEVNPLGGGSGSNIEIPTSTIKEQLNIWYNIDIKSDVFKEQVLEIYNYCELNNKILVIRDWSFVNFSNVKKYNQNNPPNEFLILKELKDFDMNIFGFVRDSIDVWISRGLHNVEDFYTDYLNYANKLVDLGVPLFKYEDFVKNPKIQLKLMCEQIGLEYTDVFETCLNFDKLNGDVQNKTNSRGIKQNIIKPLPRKIINIGQIGKLNNCKKMIKVNSKFGYPTSYYNSFWKDKIIIPSKILVKKVIK